MKQKLFVFLVFVLMAAILVGLNAASYTQKQKTPDSEMTPNRSSYNAGATGTQAFYALLSETGRKVVRWQEPADALETKSKDVPATFVVIGSVRREFKEVETTALIRWVSAGGRLVIIDRDPPQDLVTTTADWKIGVAPQNPLLLIAADPSDQKRMIGETPAAKPGQPSIFSQGVNSVQTSQFASSIVIEHVTGAKQHETSAERPPTPPEKLKLGDPNDTIDSVSQLAPVVHVASNGRNILVDAPFGEGRIVYLSDPYVVSNGGIGLVDNAQLAINIVSSGERPIAFDEYHQGYGGNNNRFLEFFAGTPVVAIFLQFVFLVGAVFFSRSRRFGRALPAIGPDRLSKLEYVSAMAELQQRTKSFDLAVENIYRDFRRRAARLVGVDNNSVSRPEFAERIAERARADRKEVEELLYKCDEIIYGEPTNKREVLGLACRIREIEYDLGLRKRPDK